MRNIFPASSSKLEDCRTNLKMIKSAKNAQEFRAGFTSFLSSARAITNALQKEEARIAGFRDWYSVKQEEMRSDSLLRFIHEARNSDFHEGKHDLKFGTYIHRMHAVGPLVVRADGPYQIVDKGTPRERLVPIESGEYTVEISIKDPPRQHLGKTIDDPNPITICELALQYFESLIYEAKTKFGS